MTARRKPGTAASARPPEVELAADARRLVVHFGAPHLTASWAVAGGGLRSASAVVFCRVLEHELRPPIDAAELARARLRAAGLPSAVALLTSRRLDRHVVVDRRDRDLHARCVLTAGMGNALRAGDPPGVAGLIGTINLVCRLSCALGAEALLEALALCAEARTLAVREAELASRASGRPASGTGTDCIVVAAPECGPALRYAGKHTTAGHLIGASVLEAAERALAAWKQELRERTHG